MTKSWASCLRISFLSTIVEVLDGSLVCPFLDAYHPLAKTALFIRALVPDHIEQLTPASCLMDLMGTLLVNYPHLNQQ